jgi:cysteinyl-tRNA synthetase
VTIRLHDTRTQTLQDLRPVHPGRVGLYVCGPTVQSAPHIGHLRSALVYDIMRRWLTASGYRVTLIRNVTDIDDKILAGAAGTAEPWWALAYRVEREFAHAYDRLGVQPPTYEPRATANIQRMIDLISRLVERGHAYPAADGSGDVYFDTASWPAYGELTHQRLEDMADAADADPRGKRDPRDFALWKGRKPDEPEDASWTSPWGRGRPGWHIECSAMSTAYLGETFDIHGGGRDLRFPHHENELAQSAAAGYGFARIWVHNGLVSVGDQKMSKSFGNSVFAADLLDRAPAQAVRYLLGSAQYRSTLEYSPAGLDEARHAVERIDAFLARAASEGAVPTPATVTRDDVPAEFARAMDDDLNVPRALAVVHERVRQGNAALAAGDRDAAVAAADAVGAMLRVLGLHPDAFARQGRADDAATQALDRLVAERLDSRAHARAARDFTTADRIRDELAAAGVRIDDTPDGARWSVDDD